jgi:Concanavalin A-like lectin/glucanases superfamily
MQKRLLTALAALCFALATTAQIPVAGLVAYWPMNGNLTDAGPNAISVTNTGVTATTNGLGMVNTSMFFNNTMSASNPNNATIFAAAAINANINFSQTASYTISHWFKINTTSLNGTGCGFFDNNLNYGGYGTWCWRTSGTTGPIQVHFNAGNVNVQSPVATTTINLNTWYHLCAVKNGTTLTMYINGVQVATNTAANSAPTYTYQSKFGTLWFNSNGNYAPFNGALDEFRIYNRVLTAAEIAAVSSLSALPVKLTSFTATQNNNSVLLNWQTEYEQNSSHFNVQRSTDGVTFENTGTVKAAGNTSVKTQYQFIDNTVHTAKTIFYRLQTVDKDSRTAISNILSVKTDAVNNAVTLLQNPAVNNLKLQIQLHQKQTVQFTITDAAGRQQFIKSMVLDAGQTSITLPVNILPAAIYNVTILAGDVKKTVSFVKQ